jgi:hypothetical protein
VGVSNTAGTLNFINNMNTNKYILWCSCCITIIIGVVSMLIVKHIELQVTSSPVEEMYHRQLVVTLDSILDARFGPGCCEEVIDSDDVSVPQTLFHNHSNMEMME